MPDQIVRARKEVSPGWRENWLPTRGLTIFLVVLAVFVASCTRGQELRQYLEANWADLNVPVSGDDRTVEFRVEPGTLARDIAEQLHAAGLIGDSRLFEAYVREVGMDQDLKAGTFFLRANMTPVEIAEVLSSDLAAGVRVTIREGWRLEQVADFLEAEGRVSGEAYRRIASEPDFSALEDAILALSGAGRQGDSQDCCPEVHKRWPFLTSLPQGSSLEGYLFPATYILPADGPKASGLILRQLDAFGERMAPLHELAGEGGSPGPTLHEALVLASIVEREAVVDLERAAIAGVLFNRLQAGMLLEVDATVQYAMGYQEASGQWWKTPVFLEEYQAVDSLYNTYLYAGLPPGPIASPGEDAFRAALNPEQHGFYFYVATPDGSGAHAFSETFAEHAENVRRYLGQ